MLQPANTQYLGGMVDTLEMDQPANFLAGLARRMGKPVQGEAASAPVTLQRQARLPPPVRHAQPVQPVTSRARVQPPPPLRPQTSSSRARPGGTQTQLAFSQSQSPEKPDTRKPLPAYTRQEPERKQSPPMSARRTPRAASQAASARVAGLYHQTELTRDDTPSKRARTSRTAQQPTTSRSDRYAPATIEIDDIDDDDFDMDFDDSFLREVDQVAASANRPIPIDMDDTSVEYGFEDDDSSFIRQVDEAEARATQRTQPVTSSRFFSTSTMAATAGGSTSARSKPKTKPKARSNPTAMKDDERPVYVIDSDGSSGKENHDPNDSDVVYLSD